VVLKLRGLARGEKRLGKDSCTIAKYKAATGPDRHGQLKPIQQGVVQEDDLTS
jgi:hypothetical protein